MKVQSTYLFLAVFMSILWIASCAPPATQVPTTQALPTQMPAAQAPTAQPVPTKISPTQLLASQATPTAEQNAEIVLNMVDRLNAGDVEGSLAYFAEDALVYLMGLPPTGIEIYKGKDQIRSLWEDSVNNHFEWEVDVVSTYGDMVNIQAKTWHDFTRQLEVAPMEYLDVYEVKDHEITTYVSWLTEESLARLKPAFAEVAPPDPTSTPSSEPPASELIVTIADGTCTTGSPITLKAGEVKVTLKVEDLDQSQYALTLFNLDPGKDILDLMVSTAGVPPSWADMLLLEELGPGESGTYTFSLDERPVYLICWSQPPDRPIGNAGPIPVVP